MSFLEGKQLQNKIKKLVSVEDAMQNKSIIIFYFGASWCTSTECKIILQKLKELHKENLRRNMGIEVIYVSSDNSEDEFDNFYKTQGGWYAVPYHDELAEYIRTSVDFLYRFIYRQLRRTFGVTNVPNVVVVRKTGEIITTSGRREIVEKGLNVLVTWTD